MDKLEIKQPGYSYFGARYYDADLSIWLSVDPLSDMYPSTSPFIYVRGNPVMLVDPNGMNDDYYEHTDENGKRSVIYREGHAATVEKDGDTYKNIGSTYTRDNGDGSYSHYVQNEYLGTNEGSIGELLQDDGYFNRALDIAQGHSYETETDVYMKAFDVGYEKSSQYAIAGALSVPIAVIAAAELAPLALQGMVWYECNTGVVAGTKAGVEYFGFWVGHTAGGEIVSTFVVATAPPSAVVALKSRQILEQSIKLGIGIYNNTSVPTTKMSIDEINKEMKSNWQINSGMGPE